MTNTPDEREQLLAVEATERATLNELIVVAQAEGVVACTRVTDLAAESKAARRRVSAARGRLTRAQRDGSAEKIVAARAALAAIDTAADAIADAALDEMQRLTRARLDSLGAMTAQIGVAWDAQAAATDTYRYLSAQGDS